jgi:hypothetical protein
MEGLTHIFDVHENLGLSPDLDAALLAAMIVKMIREVIACKKGTWRVELSPNDENTRGFVEFMHFPDEQLN